MISNNPTAQHFARQVLQAGRIEKFTKRSLQEYIRNMLLLSESELTTKAVLEYIPSSFELIDGRMCELREHQRELYVLKNGKPALVQ